MVGTTGILVISFGRFLALGPYTKVNDSSSGDGWFLTPMPKYDCVD